VPGDRPILPQEAVDGLAALSDANLPHLARVTAPVVYGPRVGGALVDPTPVVIYDAEPCRLTPVRSPFESNETGQATQRQRWSLSFRRGVRIPPNATATVSGANASGAWTRTLRVLESESTRGFTAMAKYACVDIGPTAPERQSGAA
jgi:hypothetical protein